MCLRCVSEVLKAAGAEEPRESLFDQPAVRGPVSHANDCTVCMCAPTPRGPCVLCVACGVCAKCF